jgi:fatty acid desaturase
MKHLYKLISRRVQKWYYYQELKEISLVAFIISGIWFLYNYGATIIKFIFTENGLLITAFFFASVVIAIAIKMYYRVMVIKYYEKDTNIELFKYLNEKR